MTDQLDIQIEMTVRRIRREVARYREQINRWEPRPCPPESSDTPLDRRLPTV